jgi:hypothetical protein
MRPRSLSAYGSRWTTAFRWGNRPAGVYLHVVASLLQFHHRVTAVAGLPSFLLGMCKQARQLWVVWTVPRFVHSAVARHAHFRATARTLNVLAVLVGMGTSRLDPFATFGCRTIDPVLSVIFLVLAIPEHLEPTK